MARTLSRRSFLCGATALLGAGALGHHMSTTWNLEERKHEITIQDLPEVFNGYRIGFVSDIHLGVFVADDWARSILLKMERAGLDLLLVGGDQINVPKNPVDSRGRHPGPVLSDRQRLAGESLTRQFARLLSAKAFRDGILVIPGNHDNWNASSKIQHIFAERAVRYLVNESEKIRREDKILEIVGVDDYWTGVPRLPQLSNPDRNTTRILLAHNPDYISMLLKTSAYKFHLGLAGHTHGGQICLPGGVPIVANISDRRFISGVIKTKQAPVLVSCGAGVVEIPWRLNCPAEIHEITLRRT